MKGDTFASGRTTAGMVLCISVLHGYTSTRLRSFGANMTDNHTTGENMSYTTSERCPVGDCQISLYEETLSDGSSVYGVHLGSDADVISIDTVNEKAAHKLREGLIELLTTYHV